MNTDSIFQSTEQKNKSYSILLVEDNPGDVVLIKELLRSSGIGIIFTHTSTLREAISVCVEKDYDVILLDLGLPDSTGLDTLTKILACNIDFPVIVLTGLDDVDAALESLREGAQDYLVKNKMTTDNILRAIRYGIERKMILDHLKKNARQFSLLSSITGIINECNEISDIFSESCVGISHLLDKTCVIGIESEKLGIVCSSGIKNVTSWFDQIKKMTGVDLGNNSINSPNHKNAIHDLLYDGKLHELNNEAYNSISRNKGEKRTKDIEESININIYAIGFTKSNITYGGLIIIAPYPFHSDEISIIETIGNQITLSLMRKTFEKDLKSSEARYKELNAELETKVTERTRDLESSNYMLNQQLVERHQVEVSLKYSETRLKELNNTKDKIFSIIAHDLRNPFTCLIGTTELLNENIQNIETDKVKELVQILNDSAKNGFEILQNLLDWSRSQTGMIKYNPEKINLKTLIEANISDLRFIAERKGIRIVNNVNNEISLFADINMLNSVLRNLLGNAIKYTYTSGKVEVDAKISGAEVEVSVKDNGLGIPGENIRELFRIDSLFTKPGTNKEHGTGLGLKISKEFIEMHGGRIRVKSRLNEGSEFMFTIPG